MDFCEVLECACLLPCPYHRGTPHKRSRDLEASWTLEDVKKHVKKDDCWIVINSHVYDISHFLTDHPGGPDILLDFAGQDASELFERVGHGPKARRMMLPYCVGKIDSASSLLLSSCLSSAATNPSKASSVSISTPSSPSFPSAMSPGSTAFSLAPSLLAALPSPTSFTPYFLTPPYTPASPSPSSTPDLSRFALPSIPGLFYIHDFVPLDYSKNLTNLLRRTLEGKGSYQGISYKEGPEVKVYTASSAPSWLQDVLSKYHAAGLAPLKPSQVSVNMYPSAEARMVPHKDGTGAQALILTLQNPAILRFWPKKEAYPVLATAVYEESELTGPPQDVLLMPGSLLVMTGEAFKDWVHGIVVEPSPCVLRESASGLHPATANFFQLRGTGYCDQESFERGPRISIVSWFSSRS